ncbi:MAG: MBL fold metallo-hydrolase, partial [bacterium]|nr:MBL fold metallo-hydrolase [bacterium]
MSPRFKKTVSIVFLFLALSGWVWWLWKDWDSAGLTAVFLDVGQGDGVLLTIGNDFQIVIDGGPDDSLIQKLGEYMPWYDRTIEMVILTHPDWDHVTGLVSLTERYQIGAVLYTGIQSHNAAYTELRSII